MWLWKTIHTQNIKNKQPFFIKNWLRLQKTQMDKKAPGPGKNKTGIPCSQVLYASEVSLPFNMQTDSIPSASHAQHLESLGRLSHVGLLLAIVCLQSQHALILPLAFHCPVYFWIYSFGKYEHEMQLCSHRGKQYRKQHIHKEIPGNDRWWQWQKTVTWGYDMVWILSHWVAQEGCWERWHRSEDLGDKRAQKW